MKIFEKTTVFVVTYILFLIPTYILPYGGSNSSVAQTAAGVAGGSDAATIQLYFYLHLASLLVLCAVTWIRSSAENIRWICIFPVLALIFDLTPGLSVIPLVPTLFHVLTLVFGSRGKPHVVVESR